MRSAVSQNRFGQKEVQYLPPVSQSERFCPKRGTVPPPSVGKGLAKKRYNTTPPSVSQKVFGQKEVQYHPPVSQSERVWPKGGTVPLSCSRLTHCLTHHF